MGRALSVAGIVASALLLLSCQKKPDAETLTAAIADEHSAFSIVNDLPFWSITGNALAQKGAIQIGEKLTLLGQSRRLTQAGKEREFVQVRRDTGAEGWVRSDLAVSKCILAVVTTDAVVYSVPRNTAATTTIIPRMTVLVIHSDSAGMPFIRVTGYDSGSQAFFREVYLRNEGVSARPDDVQAAILLELAAASKNHRQQEAFLTSGLKDYPGSLFLPQLQAALDALNAPQQPPAAQTPGSTAQPGQPGPAPQPQPPASSPAPGAPAASSTAPAASPAPPAQQTAPAAPAAPVAPQQ